MRTRVVWLTAVLLIGFMGLSPGHAQEVENLLVNGGFEDGVLEPWDIWSSWGDVTGEVVKELVGAAVPEGPIEGDYALHLVVPTPPDVAQWECCLQNTGHVFEKGKKYTHSAFFKCKKGEMQIGFELQISQDPWTTYSEQSFTITDEWAEYSLTSPVFTEDVSPGNVLFRLAFEVGDFWVDGVRFYEGDYVEPVFEKRLTAKIPSPEDGATDVPQDVVLSWEPSPFADTHNVYFGTVFDDVNNATGGIAQTAASYAPAQRPDFGTTYYWRVDEVNAPPDSTVFKGDVWSFTVEPFSYPIANVTATSSSNTQDMGPEKTVDGSGLNASDQHSTEPTDMWLSSVLGPQPTWIQYEFDKTYKLFEMRVWNLNQLLESLFGLGAKGVTVEYSEDGAAWTSLGDIEFAQAPGSADYTHGITIDMSGVLAKYVRLTISSNWGGLLDQYGLSEVRFYYIPVQAREPKPISEGKDIARDVVLDWRGGREAASHEVYFSSDKDAVINGTALVGTVSESSYQPGSLDFGQIYYWKINEVNDTASTPSWEGAVWNFSTIEYIVVDDFESYNDLDPADPNSNRIFNAWLDGFDNPAINGSIVGYANPPFAEQTNVHGGSQSMPFFYDNSVGKSEATLTLTYPRDWSRHGIGILSLWFRGNPVGFLEDPVGTFTMSASGADIWGTADEFRYAWKQLSGAGSISAQVLSVDNTDNWAKCGVMVRQTLDPGSKFAAVYITPTNADGTATNGCRFQARLTSGSDATSDTSVATAEEMAITAPYWIKLERDAADNLNGYYSSDGVSWQAMAWNPQKISMPSNVYIGLAFTSHNPGVIGEAEFSDVTTTGSVSPLTWTHEAIGVDITSNDPEPMYVALNGNAVVSHDNPNAALINDWTEWTIDLQAFADQGVNLANVTSITLGFGNRSNPVAGGAGMVFFDDIRLYAPELETP